MHRVKCGCGRVMYPGPLQCPACGRPAATFTDSIERPNHVGSDCDCCGPTLVVSDRDGKLIELRGFAREVMLGAMSCGRADAVLDEILERRKKETAQ